MATSSVDGDGKEAADETSILYMETLTFDLVVNILCRLPVKVLMKLRCVCKSWNSLISDPIFAKEHLRFSRTLLNRHHLLSCLGKDEDSLHEAEYLVCDSRLPFASNTIRETELTHPLGGHGGYVINSCDGIICYCDDIEIEGEYFDSFLAWNPSIRKFKILPPLKKELVWNATYGFGYDRLTDTYKLVAVCCFEIDRSNYVCKTQVMVHTLGTDTWKSIQSFPSAPPGVPCTEGIFVSGAISWLFGTAPTSWVIVALDLGNESYQELLPPNYGGADVCTMMTFGVLRDCLCILAHTNAFFIHVWLMKDYGNKDSWTQLFAIPPGSLPPNVEAAAFAHYIFEDDQLLMNIEDVVLVYNPRNGTIKIPEIRYNFNYWYYKHVYIESLISP